MILNNKLTNGMLGFGVIAFGGGTIRALYCNRQKQSSERVAAAAIVSDGFKAFHVQESEKYGNKGFKAKFVAGGGLILAGISLLLKYNPNKNTY